MLVTGSRAWSDVEAVKQELKFIAKREKEVTLVSGNCPTGADAIAEAIAVELGWTLELHPADWKTHGKRAGFVRNAEMVESGVNACLAFIVDGSAGATNTVTKAKIRKVPTRVLAVESPKAPEVPAYLVEWANA